MSFSYYHNDDEIYKLIRDGFNDYSLINKLNISLEMNLFSINNATRNRNGFFSSTEASLNRRSKTYDIYVFDPIYTKDLSSHFIDLKELLPREYLDSYSLNNIKDICVYENKWVGLVSKKISKIIFNTLIFYSFLN